jgi:hypothetical protein
MATLQRVCQLRQINTQLNLPSGSIIEWRNIHVRHFIDILGRLEFRFSDDIGRSEDIYGEVFA